MKRNLFLGFFLVGMVALEWGCCGSSVTEYSSLSGLSYYIQGEDEDSTKYLELTFSINGDWVNSGDCFSSSSAFACSNDYERLTIIDSMVILCEPKYHSSMSPLEFFQYKHQSVFDWQTSGNKGIIYNRLTLNQPPEQTDTFRFTFQVFDSKGNVYETTTEPIVITP